MRWLLLSTLVVVSQSRTQVDFYDCWWEDDPKSRNASYDLCDLQLDYEDQLKYYEVYDNNSVADVRNFSYIFNVAATIIKDPYFHSCHNESYRDLTGLPGGYCPDIDEDGNCNAELVPIENTTGAYQLGHNERRTCFRLHDGATPPTWSLIVDEERLEYGSDPTEGVVLTYMNGDWCEVAGKNRELRLKFLCHDDLDNVFDAEEAIVEDPTCVYTVNIKSTYGCPLECPVVDGHLCTDRGICEYDYSNMAPYCFCYEDWYGDDCADDENEKEKIVVDDNDGKYVAGLIVIIILLVLVTAILVYLFIRLQKITQDPNKAVENLKKKQAKSGKGGSVLLTSVQEEDAERAQAQGQTLTSVDDATDDM